MPGSLTSLAHGWATIPRSCTNCGLPPATLFHMGRLAEHHTRVTSEARTTVTKSWRKVRGRRWKSLRARLGELEHTAPPSSYPVPGPVAALGSASPVAEVARLNH